MNWNTLQSALQGELFTDTTTRKLYATDASAYRELPLAVAVPKGQKDLITLVNFARENKTGLIPRTAGTSLAGQVVGNGIVVDLSKHYGKVLEVNTEEGYAWVEPGIVRDDLNKHLAQYGVFFAPETSTANRAMIGGMIGNNSCGSNSVVYGSTREHLLEVKTILADGSEAHFGPVEVNELKQQNKSLQSKIYAETLEMLQQPINQKEIIDGFPKPDVPRRNNGYALDMLLRQQPFSENGSPFNLSSLIAGSEGTLCFITQAKLKLTPLPPNHKRLVCIHSETIDDSLRANLVALKYAPSACELMDHYILEATKRNAMYKANRFFVQGDPQAILVVELNGETADEADAKVLTLIEELKTTGHGYAYPVVKGDAIKLVWDLRKAGLGLLSNIPGDAKPAPVIEDTAVDVKDLPAYIREFNQILEKYGLFAVHYAHAGSGELHLRPILNLKTEEGQRLFRTIAEEIATLVKKYKGSLSGEHGDGRLRGEFLPQMIGEHNYQLVKQMKRIWDPENIFNPNKIVDTPPMDTFLRYEKNQITPEFDTVFDFSEHEGILRSAELCNGSGDCRKTELSGGTMCPSYMATRDEKDTTRARANMLREILTHSTEANPFDNPEIKEVMDLCLSCKGCSSECPSNVDMAKLKGEWQHQYHKSNGIPFRTKQIAHFSKSMKLASKAPWAYNLVFGNRLTGNIAKSIAGFAKERSMPALAKQPLAQWLKKEFKPRTSNRKVYFFCDEFTNYNDAEIGKTTVLLLSQLGYEVLFVPHADSGRPQLSKGLLDEAKVLAEQNVEQFSALIDVNAPLIGVEPSAILTFRDEYISLTRGEMQEKAKVLSAHVFTIEEFLAQEIDKGNITSEQFGTETKLIKVHGHCHQKSLSSMVPTKKMLSLPKNFTVHMIASGCCGMAGSFGYEKEHYEVSMKIGELVLFPTVRQQPKEVIIAAAGTSCRHQIKDGTSRIAKHPVEVLWEAVI
ncbi:FAD/FMN-containing dehydrogenase [Roseivirga ehrenbergii]|uniref:FAD-binding protein n=1 Tax=Roseivirga ehrenbergii (strain DSM 102268 / JCM 13514 / KCTC 12282 / NCIMB 14502 / KMM 6017) TaxID=279360 RepID=A0A150X7D8_ROSEK|nr:FAD-binding and (Fe-S)-binding domain-containing protein [Roseivirga ehrenbergii]KYG74606.1 FAD-binding protein [Roseivirga ehrenbergii]TCL14077.1 FAD/FMN-containing dehydrogenase [Roseivirga ehrenbergii]